MSNYIHSTNQKLLWNTVNKIPEFQNLSPPKKDLEFKQVIEYFYRKCNKSILSIQELQQINRETIMAFIPPTTKPNEGKPPLQPNPNSGFLYESKQEKSQRQFEERQNIYKQMNTKPELPSPEIFKIKEEDTAIENMDILIQQYQKQRDIEFQQYIPPPPVTNVVNINSNSKKKVRILNDVSKKEYMDDIIDLELENEKKENEKKKNVSWSTNQNQIQEYTIDDYLEKKMIQLEVRLNDIELKLENILVKQEVGFSLNSIIQQIK